MNINNLSYRKNEFIRTPTKQNIYNRNNIINNSNSIDNE
jgi:hypothetical protein